MGSSNGCVPPPGSSKVPQQPTPFQLRFQNKAVLVGKDGSNAQLAAAVKQWAGASRPSPGAGMANELLFQHPQGHTTHRMQALAAGGKAKLSPPRAGGNRPPLQHAKAPGRGPVVGYDLPLSDAPLAPSASFPEPQTAGMAEVIKNTGFLTPAQERRLLERRQQHALHAMAPQPQDRVPVGLSHPPSKASPSKTLLQGKQVRLMEGGGNHSEEEDATNLDDVQAVVVPPSRVGGRPPATNYTLHSMENYIDHLKSALQPSHTSCRPILDSASSAQLEDSVSSVPALGAALCEALPRTPHSASSTPSQRSPPPVAHGPQRRRLLPAQGPRLAPLPPPPQRRRSASSDVEIEVEEIVAGQQQAAGDGGGRRSSSGGGSAPVRLWPAANPSTSVAQPMKKVRIQEPAGRGPPTLQRRAAPAEIEMEEEEEEDDAPVRAKPPEDEGGDCSSSGARSKTVGAGKLLGHPERAGPTKTKAKAKAGTGYTPYSLEQYRTMMTSVALEKRGGLGPSDTDTQRAARQKLERQKAYGERVEREAARAIAEARIMKDINERDLSGAGEEGSRSAVGQHQTSASSTPPPTAAQAEPCGSTPRRRRDANGHLILEQPLPQEIIEARKRRERAKAYAMQVPRPAPKAVPPHLGHTISGELDKFLENPHAKALPPREQAAEERLQRLADLEARHQLYQRNVDNIRRQLRS
eukprot:gene11385-7890_t